MKTGGTSAQFLKADGSVDAAAYLTELNLSESFVKSINGTTSQINAQADAGKITLSLPDAVAIKTSVTVPNVTATTTNAGKLTAGATTLGVTTASSFVKTGGTTSQFLKADGSVDESTYLTSATLSSTLSNTFVPFNGATSNINLNSKSISNVNALSATTLTAGSFVRSGGTSSQYLRADGSVDATVVTSSNASSTLSNTFVLNSNFESGMYVPVFTISAAATFNSYSQATYMKVGNIINVNVGFTVTGTNTSGDVTISMTLPKSTTKTTQNYIGIASLYNANTLVSGNISVDSGTTIKIVTSTLGNAKTYNGNITFSYSVQ